MLTRQQRRHAERQAKKPTQDIFRETESEPQEPTTWGELQKEGWREDPDYRDELVLKCEECQTEYRMTKDFIKIEGAPWQE
jgi:hypothetical protein